MFSKNQIIVLILFTFLIQISCSQKDNIELETIKSEILSLETIENKEVFLNNLFTEDQKYRSQESDIILKYGFDSKEFHALWNKIQLNDSINFIKTKFYLKNHGYPSCKVFKEMPCSLLIYIDGHQGSFEKQKEVYSFFYDAYKSGNLDEDSMLWVLDEMYERKNLKNYHRPPSYKVKERIKELISILGL